MKKENIKLSIFWIFSFFVIIFIMTQTVNAAEPEEPSYPLYIDFAKNPIDTSLEEIQNAYSLMWGDLPESYIIYCSSHDSHYINGSHGWDYYDTYTYVISVNPIFEYPLTLDVNSSSYYITNGSEYYFEYIPDIDHWGSYNSASNIRHQYAYYYMAQGLGYILYGTEEDYTSTNDVVVWSHRHSAPIDIGVAIVPPEPILPDYPSGTTPPAQVPPTFTAADYNWTTPPTFDSSSIENAIGSIQNTLGWIANNLKEEFKNLTNNLKGFFKYIGDTIQYYGNALLSTLNNFIQNFYDNMKSLVEPIFQKIDYITTPLEADVIWDNISGTSLITNYSSILNAASSMKSSFENLSEPTDYKIPIHLEDLPSSWFGNLTTQYIDLGIINPVKSILRTFMWALITYSLFVTIIDSIANYINGGGDES